MTAAFDCPKCGAPLSFEPQPGQETVECPYCHENVIIPDDLRVQPPPAPKADAETLAELAQLQREEVQAPQPRRPSRLRQVITILVISLFVVPFVIGMISGIIESITGRSSSSASSDTSTSFSVSDSATATVETKATSAVITSMLKQEQNWPASFTDKFTDNSHKWDTGDARDSYINGNRSISNGAYTWKITAVQSTSDFSMPTMPDEKDFYASVDMNLVSMPVDDPNADAGMVFRDNATDQTWYYFSVNNTGQYYFGWYDGNNWSSLIPDTDSSAIHVGQTNRLTVGVQGSQFIFLINGQVVDHFIDDNLKSGVIGLGVNLPQTGDKATVKFSNFTVLSPPQKP
jgi:hypothetical protein